MNSYSSKKELHSHRIEPRRDGTVEDLPSVPTPEFSTYRI